MHGSVLERATLMSCSQSSLLLFLVFISTNFENPCSQRYDVTKGVRTSRAALARWGYPSIWRHQKLESVVVPKTTCCMWLCWSSIRSSRYGLFTLTVVTSKVKGCHTQAGYCWMSLSEK